MTHEKPPPDKREGLDVDRLATALHEVLPDCDPGGHDIDNPEPYCEYLATAVAARLAAPPPDERDLETDDPVGLAARVTAGMLLLPFCHVTMRPAIAGPDWPYCETHSRVPAECRDERAVLAAPPPDERALCCTFAPDGGPCPIHAPPPDEREGLDVEARNRARATVVEDASGGYREVHGCKCEECARLRDAEQPAREEPE
jgi:hypothetical protein